MPWDDNDDFELNDFFDYKDFVTQLKKAFDEAERGSNKQLIKYYKTLIKDKSKLDNTYEKQKLQRIFQDEKKVENYREEQDRKRHTQKLKREIEIVKEEALYRDKTYKKASDDYQKALKELNKAYLEGDTKGIKKASKSVAKAEGTISSLEKQQDRKEDLIFKGFKNPKQFGAELTGNLKAGLVNSLNNLKKAFDEGLNQINNAIKSYAKYQTTINTRLQGSSKDFSSATNVLSNVAFSPLVNSQELYSNLNSLVNEGVVTNVEQRAFFMTVKDSIATTFEANNAALKRIIRIQQDDSTAARLGMESYLTRFLNEFVESTEYLTTTFDTVAESLLEASALMSTKESTQFEYIVQKWLGTLTGVGLSENSATMIASALGKLGAGDTSVFNEGIGSLLTLAANNVGLNLGSVLNGGLGANEANDLLLGLTQVLQGYGSSSSNVVKSQLANIFGLKVSDLQAISKNLDSSQLTSLYDSMMSYNDMYTELGNQFGQIKERMGLANILENAMSNFTYQTGMNIASNAATYTAWKVTDLIQSVTGGINLPSAMVLGTGVDLNTTVENLIKTGIVGISTISSIGDILDGIKSVGNGSLLLDAIGAYNDNATLVKRGSGLNDYTIADSGIRRRTSGLQSSSVAGYQANGADLGESAVLGAKDEANKQLNESDIKDEQLNYLIECGLKEKLFNLDKNISSLVSEGITVKNLVEGTTSAMQGFFNPKE